MRRERARVQRRIALHVLQQAPVAIAVLDGPDHKLSLPNAAWRDLFAYRGPLGVPIASLNLFDDAGLARIARTYATGATEHIERSRLPQPTRDHEYINTVVQPLRDGRRRITGVSVVCEFAPHELFSSKVSHDLGGPLATILLWEQVLRESEGGTEHIRQALDAIRASAEDHARVLTELRTHGRLRTTRDGHELAPLPPVRITASGKLKGIKVLLLDDDPHLVDALRLLLARAGAAVDCHTSAAAAFARLEHEQFDVLLTDLTMPEEHGCHLIQRVRRAGIDVAAIALTALSSDEDRERALSSGFDRHLTKPVSLDRLVSSILDVLA